MRTLSVALLMTVGTAARGDIIYVGPTRTYTTIEQGYAAANPLDTLLIDDGNYVFGSTFNVAKNVTFKAANVGGVRISGGGSGVDDALFFLSSSATFSGLYFTASNSSHGIYQRDTGATGTVERSIFSGITTPIEINNSGGNGGRFDVSHVTIVNAIEAFNINDGGIINVLNSIIANANTAYSAHNNIVITPDHNLLFNVNSVNGGDGSIGGDPAQIIGDPLFVNAAGGDFRLLFGSPAIDSGLYFGQSFFGAGPDRGAFEFGPVPEPNSFALAGILGLGWTALRRRRLRRLQ